MSWHRWEGWRAWSKSTRTFPRGWTSARAVQGKDNPADLIDVALERLVKERLELPGRTTPDAMASEIRIEVTTRFFAQIAALLVDADIIRILGLPRVVSGSRSRFDEPKRPAKAPTVSHLREHLAYLDRLELLGPTATWLEAFRWGRWGTSPGQARVLDAAELGKVGAVQRTALLVVPAVRGGCAGTG
ncbi:hypothetical protein ACGH2B_06545 [Streptomyces sp. BBFR2]|uniref:hypothetical protein n=1 Tax=Streptomyces sp. BBFR2 TaxID=3372854 RepID=UPI0037D99F3F